MLKKFTRFFICHRIAASAIPFAVWLVILLSAQQSAAQPALNVWRSNGPNAYINTMVVDPHNPNVVYAGINDCSLISNCGVFKSVNNGASWFRVNQMGVSHLEIDFVNPNTIYAGTNSGIFKSVDGGVNWNPFSSPVDSGNLLAVAPSNPAKSRKRIRFF